MIDRAFPGDSNHAKRLRTIDWLSTGLGPPDRWGASLRTALHICAASRTPACVMWGRDLTVIFNEAAAKRLGSVYAPRVLAHSGRELWPQLEAALVPLYSAGGRVTVEVGEGDHRFELACSPIHGDDGQTAGVWAEIGDRSDEDLLRSDARAKDDFLAQFAHEVRNPLSVISIGLQRLLRQSPSVEATLMDRAVRDLTWLIDDLFDLSRLHRGKLELRRANIELAQVIELAMSQQRDVLEQRKTHVELHVPPTGLAIDCDPERIAQALGNVIHNAAKYSEPHATVVISAARTNGRVSISVRDQGSGVTAERLSGVFDAFHSRGTKPHNAGPGLGLAIARNLIELHGGEVRASSAGTGTGTEIVFELPVVDSPPAPSTATPRKRILVVEDNHDTAVALQHALEQLGHAVAIAHNGPVALTVARAFQPDVAMLDINLPVMDGWELAKRLRAVLGPSRKVHFVAVTARDQDDDKERSSDAGFAEHLVKPIDLSQLERIVASLPDPRAST